MRNFASENHRWINFAKMDWYQGLRRPGAEQMRYPLKLRNIVGWQDWHHLVHDQTCLTTNSEHGKHCRAMKTKNGSHIVIYSPMDGRLEITDESVSGRNGIWFYPRTGNLSTAEYTLESGSATFQKPNGVGWILILRQ